MKTIDIREPLLTCLEKFSGADEKSADREKSLQVPFKALAKKLIHGGYFAVSDKDAVKYRIYIHSVEFYYHEEKEVESRVCDWVMYHRNPLYGRKKESLTTGSLFPHDSGIDITFEDQQEDPENVRYRASALIRSFQVTDGDNENMLVFENRPKHIFSGSKEVEYYPTHLFQYLLNKIQLPTIRIDWIDKDICEGEVYVGRRINVFKRVLIKEGKGRVQENIIIPDSREWAFCKEKIEVQLAGQEKFTFK